MTQMTCPLNGELERYSVGRMSPAELNAISQHLETCADCNSTLSEMDDFVNGNDSVLAAIRTAAASSDMNLLGNQIDEQELAAVMNRVKAMGNVGCSLDTVTDEWVPPDFRLLTKLGSGGMGTVYQAEHQVTGKIVALKTLVANRLTSRQALARLQRERRAVERLNHPNIVAAGEAAADGNRHYFVMEYVDGADLSTLLRALGRLSVPDACEIVRQVALGLHHAHQHGLVHRDVKPSNIMVSVTGQVKLLDLGLAMFSERDEESHDLTFSGQVMGTLDYMAPEQLDDSRQVDRRADSYGLGATLFKLLTGKAPLEGEKLQSTVKKILAIATKPANSAVASRPELAITLNTLLQQMLDKSPERRPDSLAAVAKALERHCGGHNLPALIQQARKRAALKRPVCESQEPDEKSVYAADIVARIRVALAPLLDTRSPYYWLIGSLSAVVFTLIFLLGALSLQTPPGELVIESPDNHIQVQVSQGGKTVNVVGEQAQWSVRLPNGEYHLRLVGDTDFLRLEKETVTVKRGDKLRVRVRLDRSQIAAYKTPQPVTPPTPQDSLPKAATVEPPSKPPAIPITTISATVPPTVTETLPFSSSSSATPPPTKTEPDPAPAQPSEAAPTSTQLVVEPPAKPCTQTSNTADDATPTEKAEETIATSRPTSDYTETQLVSGRTKIREYVSDSLTRTVRTSDGTPYQLRTASVFGHPDSDLLSWLTLLNSHFCRTADLRNASKIRCLGVRTWDELQGLPILSIDDMHPVPVKVGRIYFAQRRMGPFYHFVLFQVIEYKPGSHCVVDWYSASPSMLKTGGASELSGNLQIKLHELLSKATTDFVEHSIGSFDRKAKWLIDQADRNRVTAIPLMNKETIKIPYTHPEANYAMVAAEVAPRLSGVVVKVRTQDEFVQALKNLKPGGTMILDRGEFSFPEGFSTRHTIDRDRVRLDEFPTLRDVMLVGQGQEVTTISTTNFEIRALEKLHRVRLENLQIDCRDKPICYLRNGGLMEFRNVLFNNFNSGAGGSAAIDGSNAGIMVDGCMFEAKSGRVSPRRFGSPFNLRGDNWVYARHTVFQYTSVQTFHQTTFDECSFEQYDPGSVDRFADMQHQYGVCFHNTQLNDRKLPSNLSSATDDHDFVLNVLVGKQIDDPIPHQLVVDWNLERNLMYLIGLTRNSNRVVRQLAAQRLKQILPEGASVDQSVFLADFDFNAVQARMPMEIEFARLMKWYDDNIATLRWQPSLKRYQRRQA